MLKDVRKYTAYILNSFLILISLVSFLALSSATTHADESVIDDIAIGVPVSCTLSGTGMDTHNANIPNGTYRSDIGTTTLKASCNDQNGFAIYAAGYTGEVIGGENSNKLVGSTAEIGNIITGTATSAGNPDVSNWAMKLATNQNATYPITLDNSFGSYHTVPNEYTKVAHRDSSTDVGQAATGATLTTTYAAYISKTQGAGTYAGKVIYTLVHPHSAPAPVPVSKNLYYAITGSADNYTLTISDSDITSGAVASGPVAIDGYTYNEGEWILATPWYSYAEQIKNVVVNGTVAPTSTSAWFAELTECETWNLDGLRTDHVTNMSEMFFNAGRNAAAFTLNLSSWNTSSVTDMSYMFYLTGYINATTWSVGDLSSWDTSKVTDMSYMFSNAGSDATTWSVGDLSSWDTSKVTDMSGMFMGAGSNGTTFSLNLSSWDTSSVTDMSGMFLSAGHNITTFSLDLSSWDTSSVTNMSNMFRSTGNDATTWSVGDLSSWDTSKVTDMSYMFSDTGKDTTTFSLDLSSWDTSSVTNMSNMFYYAGFNATTFSLNLSSWDTSSVTNMSYMFSNAGRRSSTTFILNLSSWDTSSVTNMSNMFYYAGNSASTWSVTIPQDNGAVSSPITNTTSRLYGETTSTYAAPPSGKSFTLAN